MCNEKSKTSYKKNRDYCSKLQFYSDQTVAFNTTTVTIQIYFASHLTNLDLLRCMNMKSLELPIVRTYHRLLIPLHRYWTSRLNVSHHTLPVHKSTKMIRSVQ